MGMSFGYPMGHSAPYPREMSAARDRAMESPGHWIHASPTGEIFIGSLTGNVFRWYPGWLSKGADSEEGLQPVKLP